MSKEYTLKPNEDTIEKVRKEFDLDERKIKEAVEGIKNWLELQPHLPKVEDDGILERWLIRCKNNMERLKQAIDMYYSSRNTCPELMSGWDVNDPWFDNLFQYVYGCVMPEMTPECDRIVIVGIRHSDTRYFNVSDFLKINFLFSEIRMCEDYFLKQIYIVDFKNVTVNHITKICQSIFEVGKFMKFNMGAYCWRIGAIHFVNAPSYADKAISLVKSVMKNKIAQRVHVHGTDLTELYTHVPKRLLPIELGGDSGSLVDYAELAIAKLKDNREWLLKREKLKADESKRPSGQKNYGEIFGVDGSFRQLSID